MFDLIKVTKKYSNGKEAIVALDNFSYHFNNKGFYAIVGPSGSGKSTLLHILAGLENEVLGEVKYLGKDFLTFGSKRIAKFRRNNLGMIYQNAYLIPYLDVKGNISMRKKNIDEKLVYKLGITRLLDRNVTKLSGGQRQRVSLARALSHNPKIILADEPTGALDYNNAVKVMDILKQEANYKLVIMVSHDKALCEKYADTILTLEEGKLIKETIINKKDNSKLNDKRIKSKWKGIFKLAFAFLKYKRKRILMTGMCCSLGIIGMLLSIILTDGFTTFFNKQFENSINSNVIYGYPQNNTSIATISLFDIQNIALDYNLDWNVFYSYNSEIKFEARYKDINIEWLDINSLFHYEVNENFLIDDSQTFVLNFPRKYFSIFSNLFGQIFLNENQVSEYVAKNNLEFSFLILKDNQKYIINLTLLSIKWDFNNDILIIHNSKLWLEDIFASVGLIIDSKLESNHIIRYPYLFNFKENKITNLLNDIRYQKIVFDFDVEYRDKTIALCYYGSSSRVNVSALKKFLVYDNVIDYLYISNNGVTLEQKLNSLKFNNIKGSDISFYPINLTNEKLKEQYILYGNIPKNNTEVIVSSTLLENLGIRISDEIIVIHKLGNKIKLKVVGYIEGNQANLIYQKGSWSYEFFIDELKLNVKDLTCYQISLLMDNSKVIPYYVSFFNSEFDEYSFISPLWEANREIENILNYFKFGIMILSFFSIFVSLLLVGIVIFINTIEQKKYDAILIMQGYMRKDILKIHIYQNLLMCFIAYIITLFSSVFIVIEINTVFSLMIGVSYYPFATLPLDLIIKLMVFTLGIGLIFGCIPFGFIKLDNPLKILKE